MTRREAEAKIRRALERRYKAPEWGFLHEVPNGTGGRKKRTADALAMSIWPSRGLTVHGFEIKTDRSDWLRELADPAKSEPIQKYCEYWWVVTEKDVIDDSDAFPETWGHIERRGGKLFTVREAPRLEPEPCDRVFLAALFRKLADAQAHWIPKSRIADEIAAARAEAERLAKEMADIGVREHKRRADELQQRIDRFEQESGVRIDRHDVGRIASAVKFVRSTTTEGIVDQFERHLRSYRMAADGLERAIAEFRETTKAA